MLIKKSEVTELSNNIRKAIDGQMVDFRDNREGAWSILKNDIHTLVSLKSENVDAFSRERDLMAESLANISHQLKTPLTSMMLMADLLETAPGDKQAEFIANIKIGLTRMEWLVSALLKMAKLDAGAIEFSKNIIPGSELLQMALEPLQILLDMNNQCVEIVNDMDMLCDKRWTAEALTNVLKNASEYSPMGSKIIVDCGMNPICKWISIKDAGGNSKRVFRSKYRNDSIGSSRSFGA